MPGSMIHLVTAYKVNPYAGVRFWIGNIAPDAVGDWHEKEIKHLRNLADRTEAITTIAMNSDKADEFAEGMLLHLYLDWKWDVSVKAEYIQKTGEDWFKTYRHELGLASNYAYNHLEWSGRVWEEMDRYHISGYGSVDGATADELESFIHYGCQWHHENNIGPSTAFLPEMIETFTDKVAKEYTTWRKFTEEDS